MTTSATTRPSRRAGGGFTLIELCVVLVIVALVLAVTLPRYGSILLRGTLASESRRIAAACRYLSSEAARTGKPHYLNFETGKDAYWVTVDEGKGAPVEQASPLAEPYILADGVFIRDVVVPRRGGRSAGIQRVGFFAKGENEEALVRLSDYSRKRTYTVRIKPYGGRAVIYDRDVR